MQDILLTFEWFSQMSQWQAIDIMTYNSYSLQYYSFRKGKIGFGFLKHEYRFLFLGPCQFTPDVTVWQLTVSQNEFFALQITDNR